MEIICDVCNSKMSIGLQAWHFVCRNCNHERSTLEPQINSIESINETQREIALRSIRDNNFDILLSWLSELKIQNHRQGKPRLLDIGCAHGWFLEKSQSTFYPLGIEPDAEIAKETSKKSVNVRLGFFPEALESNERFDVIVFNDVLEHIPSVNEILEACFRHLESDGTLVINAPNKNGVFYRLSKLLHKLGRPKSFERMWQVGMPSPHLYYFDDHSIASLAKATGFCVYQHRALPSVVKKGLFERVSFAGGSRLKNCLISCILYLLIPFIQKMESDISVWLLRKR